MELVHEPVTRLAAATLVATGVEDDAVEPCQEGLLAWELGSIHFDEHLLHGVVDLLAEPLEEEDAAHLRRVAAKELGARLRLLSAQAVYKAVRQFFYGLPPQ
jgi:hypothetical protein